MGKYSSPLFNLRTSQGKRNLATAVFIFLFITCFLIPTTKNLNYPYYSFNPSSSRSRLTSEFFDNPSYISDEDDSLIKNAKQQQPMGLIGNLIRYEQVIPKVTFERTKRPEKPNYSMDKTDMHNFYHSLFTTLKDAAPGINESLSNKYGKLGKFDTMSKEIFSKKYLSQFLQVTDKQVEILKKSHKKAIDTIPHSMPAGLYKGYGVVIVGGGRFTPMGIIALKMLRKVSKTIPVEFLVEESDMKDKRFCNEFLPSLNAQCLFLPDRLGPKAMKMFKFKGYQFKVLSILASSFDTVIMIDADNIVLHDPVELLKSRPFQEKRAILWPDFWRRTVSPKFYDIAGIKLGQVVRGDIHQGDPDKIPLADYEGALPDMSTESGQLVIEKGRHFKALVLMVYYNLYGPDVYYPLLSQGALGEGDKESFAAAFTVLQDDVYYIHQGVRAGGYWKNGEFAGTYMLQADPQEDYLKYVDAYTSKRPRNFFLHNNMIKMDPYLIMNHKEYKKRLLGRGQDDSYRLRYQGNLYDINGIASKDRDVELEIWETAEWLSCRMVALNQVSIGAYENVTQGEFLDICERVQANVDWLRTHRYSTYLPVKK